MRRSGLGSLMGKFVNFWRLFTHRIVAGYYYFMLFCFFSLFIPHLSFFQSCLKMSVLHDWGFPGQLFLFTFLFRSLQMLLALLMLSKLRYMPTSNFQPIRVLIQVVDINSHAKWQTVQIQISWLLQEPTDLDLHCLQRQGSVFSRTRVKPSKL